MLICLKHGFLFIALAFVFSHSQAQTIVKEFQQDSLTNGNILVLQENCCNNKNLPNDFEKQALIALSYFPELEDVKIRFRTKNKTTPLTTRPSFTGMFRSAKKRTYIITISKKSISYLDTILLQNLSYNAQIGVLGHELCHVSDFINKGFGSMCQVAFGHFSKKYVDRFEFNTDRACINHGLGYQLLAWSINVRENLKSSSWLGAATLPPDATSERYMNPSTIESILPTNPLYQKQ